MIRANLKLASNCFIILLVVTKTCNPFLYYMRSKFSRLSLVFAFFLMCTLVLRFLCKFT